MDDLGFTPLPEDDEDSLSFTSFPDDEPTPEPEPVQESARSQYNDRMYDGLTDEEARAKYEEAISGDNVEKSTVNPLKDIPLLGNFVPDKYNHVDPETGKRTIIPRPTNNIVDQWWQYLMYGAEETAGDMLVTGAAVTDYALGTDTLNSDMVKSLDADINTSKLDNAIIADAIPAIFGGGLGIKGANAAVNTFSKAMPKVAAFINKFERTRRLGKLALQGAGANAVISAGVDTSEDQLLFGENALFQLGDMDKYADLGETEQAEIIEHRIETFMDGAAMGMGIGAGTASARFLGNLVFKHMFTPTVRGFSKSGVEKAVAEDINRILNQIGPETTAQQRAELSNKLADIVENNKNTLTKGLVDVNGNPLDIGPLELLAMSDGTSPELMQEITNLLKGVDGRGQFPKTNATLRAGDRAREEALDTGAQRYSGEAFEDMPDGVMQDAAAELAEGSNRTLSGAKIDDFLANEQAAKGATLSSEAYSKQIDDITQALRNDPDFGAVISKLDAQDANQLNESLAVGSRDGIVAALDQSYTRMSNMKNQKYLAVKDGTVDTEALYDFFDAERLNAFSSAMNRIGQSRPYSRFARMVETIEKAVAEGDLSGADAQKAFAAFVKKDIPDYGTLYRDIRGEVSQLASILMRSDNPGDQIAATHLRRFASFIQDDMLEGVKNADPDLGAAADEARRFFKQEFAPLWRGEKQPLARFAELHDATVGRTSVGDEMDALLGEGKRFDEASFQAEGVKVVDDAVKRTDSVTPANLKRALGESDAQNRELVADYYVIQALEQTAGKDYAGMVAKLEPFANILKNEYPKKYERINKLLKLIQEREAVGQSTGDVTQLIDDSVKKAKNEISEQAFLRHFQEEIFGKFRAKDGNEAFPALFKKITDVGDLLASIEKLPEARREIVQKGLRGSYLRMLRDAVQSSEAGLGGAKSIKSASAGKVLERSNNVLRIGEMIFKDEPEYMKVLETLIAHSRKVQNIRTARSAPGQSETAFVQEAHRGIDNLIMITLGPLNRTATRTRAIYKLLHNSKDPTAVYNKIRDDVLSNPDEFIRIMRNNDEMYEERLKVLARWARIATVRTDFNDSQSDIQADYEANSPDYNAWKERQKLKNAANR